MGFEELSAIIKENMTEPCEIRPESTLSADLHLCSFDIMMVIMQIERTAGVRVNVSGMTRGMTVEGLRALIG